jgi:hypothetical protein
VRHIKDGRKSIEKANLISANDVLSTEHYKLNTEYFPSYEIMMDELRDHRFYAEDMLHPSRGYRLYMEAFWRQFQK